MNQIKIFWGGVEICDDGLDNDCDGSTDVRCVPDIDFVFIQGNTTMFSQSRNQVLSIPTDFYISKTEITIKQYRACVDAGVCSAPTSVYSLWDYSDRSNDNKPINAISWQQARNFAQWVGGDLPSETQWEYVARSQGQNRMYVWADNERHWGECYVYSAGYGSDESCSRFNHLAVGGFLDVCSMPMDMTDQGVCDMQGNTSEWVLDSYFDVGSIPNYVELNEDSGAFCRMGDCAVCEQNIDGYMKTKTIKGVGIGSQWSNTINTIHDKRKGQEGSTCGERVDEYQRGVSFRVVKY